MMPLDARRRRDFAIPSVGLLLGCFLVPTECTNATEISAKISGFATVPTEDQVREMEKTLWQQVLDAWFPRCRDKENGGFHEDFAEDWSRQTTQSKFILFQARMTWTAATIAKHYPKHRERFLSYARHGLDARQSSGPSEFGMVVYGGTPAGTAAAMATRSGTPVEHVDINTLQPRVRAAGQILDWQ